MENERLNKDIDEISMKQEDWEVQSTFEEMDVRECEVIEGGDIVDEATEVASSEGE